MKPVLFFDEKQVKIFFKNKILINFEQEKEKKLIEIKNIEKERDFFDNMSYIKKVKYNFSKSDPSIYLFLVKFSELLFLPFFFIGVIISLFFADNFHKGFINSFLTGISPFVVCMSLYIITIIFNNIIFFRPNFEKKIFYKMKDIYEISEKISSKKQSKAISEIDNANFFDEEILSWETRDVLRIIKLNAKDVEKIKKIGSYHLEPEKDLLDFYFLIRRKTQ